MWILNTTCDVIADIIIYRNDTSGERAHALHTLERTLSDQSCGLSPADHHQLLPALDSWGIAFQLEGREGRENVIQQVQHVDSIHTSIRLLATTRQHHASKSISIYVSPQISHMFMLLLLPQSSFSGYSCLLWSAACIPVCILMYATLCPVVLLKLNVHWKSTQFQRKVERALLQQQRWTKFKMGSKSTNKSWGQVCTYVWLNTSALITDQQYQNFAWEVLCIWRSGRLDCQVRWFDSRNCLTWPHPWEGQRQKGREREGVWLH